MTSIMPLQNPQSAKRKTRRKKVKATLRPSSMMNMPRRAVCGSTRAAPVARAFVVAVAVAISDSLKRDAHLRANHDHIRNVTGTAGINYVLQVGLNVTPLCYLKPVPEFQHLFGFSTVTATHLNATSVVITQMTVDKMHDGAVVFAAWNQALVMEPGVDFERHNRDLLLRIVT